MLNMAFSGQGTAEPACGATQWKALQGASCDLTVKPTHAGHCNSVLHASGTTSPRDCIQSRDWPIVAYMRDHSDYSMCVLEPVLFQTTTNKTQR